MSEASGDAASANSSDRSASAYVRKRAQGVQGNRDNETTDLLGQKRSFQEGVFACMYTLARQTVMSGWKIAVLRVVLEFLMSFRVVFNSFSVWKIDTSSPVWQVVTWILWRGPVSRYYGYKAYVTLMYVMASTVLLCLVGLAWLTMAMRRQEQSKLLRMAALALHVVYDVVFVMCYASFFDYFTFAGACHYKGAKNHTYFTDVACLQMPHLLHMTVALATGLVYLCVTALMLVASCDLDPLSRGYMASPAAYARLKILGAKAVYIILASFLNGSIKVQAIGMAVCVTMIVLFNLRSIPFYRTTTNVIWIGLWGGILYTCVLFLMLAFGKDHSAAHYRAMTKNVLYGMFPTIIGSMGLARLYIRWAMRPARKILDMPAGTKLARVHKFESVHEVERLARVMRVFDEDGLVEQQAAALGETIIKAGMQTFPNSPHLLILYANFILEARKDGPSARTQLQLAGKAAPNLVERYQIFCTNEASKRLKDSAECGMDLQAYIEFKRNFRAVLRVHKEAVLQQAELWQLLMHPSVRVAQVDRALETLEVATARAHHVYKRVLERYPSNGKLLRCYGKFLEDCAHDQPAAARAYGEANRNGGAGNGGMLALDVGGAALGGASGGKPDFLTSMSIEDDAVVVTDAEGKILMVSQTVQDLFGHTKTELEGANVSVLMPQPFSQRHPGYMGRYVATGESSVLDTVRQVVALHKERYVFPISLCVTKLSGTGTDSVFLGVFRPLPPLLTSQRAWITPHGVFLCADQHFASSVGIMEAELVGHTLASLVADPEDVERLLLRCREATADVLESGSIQARLLLVHRYLDPVPVDVTVRMAGSDSQRILVLHCARTDGQDGGVMAVDSHMRIRFASCEVALLTGYPLRRLAAMKLADLLPPPYNVLHAKWLREPPRAVPPGSCRSGAMVHLVSETGVQVPVKIQVKTVDGDAVGSAGAGAGGVLHIVQVTKLTGEEVFAGMRLVLTTDFSGRVLDVSPRHSSVFDFQADSLVGACLSDFIDLFADWRQRSGEGQMQLLLLALLDKEAEMPGTSWRVKVHAPSSAYELPALPGQTKTPRKGLRTACLQVDLLEGGGDDTPGECGDGGSSGSSSRVVVSLWRRDLLSGVAELDEELTVRKASPLTALITGLPVTAMVRRPLGRLVDLPPAATSWEALVSACSAPAKKSALKASSDRGSVSPQMAFIGPHPDTGTMRLLVQGVRTLGPAGRPRITLTLRPDTAFVGAHADLMRVLKLGATEGAHASHGGDQKSAAAAATGLTAGGNVQSRGRRAEESRASAQLEPPAASSPARGDEGGAGDADSVRSGERGALRSSRLHHQASSKSEFVAQWVRAVSKQLNPSQRRMAPLPEAGPGELPRPALAAVPEVSEGPSPERGTVHDGLVVLAVNRPPAPFPDPNYDPDRGSMARCGASSAKPWSSRQPSHSLPSPPPSPPAAKRPGAGGGKGGGGGDCNRSDKDSENDASSIGEGSQAASAISGTTDGTSATELMVDARRGRLLTSLNRLLLGPSLLAHANRLHLHSYAVICLMFLGHLVGYVVLSSLIKLQHDHVYEVVDQAMAMDRSHLILCRVIIGAFCGFPGIMRVSICSNPLSYTLARLTTAVNELERFHQSVYLGVTSKVAAPTTEVYNVWTLPRTAYSFFTDTTPPQVIPMFAGAWALGNRYIAAAREALHLLPTRSFGYLAHRTCTFAFQNGFGPLFDVYATSQDLLVNAAWNSVQKLRTELVILLVVEALFVQLCCTLYELLLVRRLERARLLGVLAMLALPGPVLRQLAASDHHKIIDDSDEEAEDNDSLAGDEDNKALGPAPVPGTAAIAGNKSAELHAPQGPGRNSAIGWHSTVSGDGDEGANAAGGSDVEEEQGAEGEEQGRRLAGTTFKSFRNGKRAAPQTVGDVAATSGPQCIRVNGKALTLSRWNVGKFMAPLLIWNLAVVLVYAVSVAKLNSMQGPLASLNMAAHVTYRYTRVRALSLGFLIEPLDMRPVMRQLLTSELDLFESEYDALMYGGLPLSLVNRTFQRAAPAATFESAAFIRQFFTTKRCLRYNQSACLTTDSPYYEVTHNGLDVLVRRMLSEMRLLVADADADLAYNNSRYSFMAVVAGNDMYEGLQQATQLFVDYSISRYDQVTSLHEVLLIVSIFLVMGFFGFLLWPHCRRMLRDASRQSGLLSLVPPEMDVRGHVRSVFKRAVAVGRRG